MNKIYKVIWSKAKNCYVVASELAKSHTSGSGSRLHKGGVATSAALTLAVLLSVGGINTNVYAATNTIVEGTGATAVTDGSIAVGTNAVAGAADGTGIDYSKIINPRTHVAFQSQEELVAYVNSVNDNDQIRRAYLGKLNDIAIGSGAQAYGGRVISIGENAGSGVKDNWNIQNVNIGTQANANSVKDYSVAVGYQAGYLESQASQDAQATVAAGNRAPSVLIGKEAGKNTASYGNIGIGTQAAENITDTRSVQNIAIGTQAGYGATSDDGVNQTFKGFGAGANVMVGTQAGYNVSGDGNLLLGNKAGAYGSNGKNMTGDDNIMEGHMAGAGSTSRNSIIMGSQAADSTQNSYNVLIGSWVNGTGYDRNTQTGTYRDGSSTDRVINNAVALGSGSSALANGATTIGANGMATANATAGTVVGVASKIDANQAIAVGTKNVVSGANSAVVGNNNTVTTVNTQVLGNNVTTTADNSVILGNKSAYTAESDTTKGLNNTYTSDEVNGQTKNFAGGDSVVGVVSVGGATTTNVSNGVVTTETRRIQNVAPGLISETSTDAVNGSQLNSVVEEVNKGVSYAGDYNTDGTQRNNQFNQQLGDTTNIVGGADASKLTDNNIGVVSNGSDTLTVKLNKDVNLTNDGSLTVGGTTINNTTIKTGDTVINGDSITTNTVNAPTVNSTTVNATTVNSTTVNANTVKSGDVVINGNTNTVNNLSNTTWNINNPTVVSGQAATEDQLKTVSDQVKQNTGDIANNTQNITNNTNDINVLKEGWNVTTSATGTGVATGSATTAVKAGDTVTLTAGNNINIAQNGQQVTIATSDTPNFQAVTVKDGVDGKDGVSITGPKGADGATGEAGQDGKVGITGKDGKDAVSISGKDGIGHIGLTGPAGKDGQNGTSADISVAPGYNTPGVDGKDGQQGANGVDGQDGITRIVYTDQAGQEHQVATMEDGLKFAGDDGQTDPSKVIAKKLNNTVDITGGATGALTNGNIGVNNVDGQLKVQLANDINLKDSNGNAGSVTTGHTVLNDNGVTIINNTDATKTVSVTNTGLNNGGNQIVNQGSGSKCNSRW